MSKIVLLLVAICAVLAVVAARPGHQLSGDTESLFKSFIAQHGKHYKNDHEYNYRLAVFESNLKRINALNAQDEHAEFGVTKFSDLSAQEFRDTVLMADGLQRHHELSRRAQTIELLNTEALDQSIPNKFDWRNSSAVTKVYDQGQCGSCWAFSTVENIESVWHLAGHPLTSLSIQQVVDCDKKDQGCNGGDPPIAYEYIIHAGGLESAATYDYTGRDGKCHFDQSKVTAKISSWAYITKSKNETEMQVALVNKNPLSICVEADTWQFYTSGVISKNCGDQLDHCVLLVGYDTEASKNIPYWIIRNSWGTDWGVNGYLFVERNKDLCGLADECTTAIV